MRETLKAAWRASIRRMEIAARDVSHYKDVLRGTRDHPTAIRYTQWVALAEYQRVQAAQRAQELDQMLRRMGITMVPW